MEAVTRRKKLVEVALPLEDINKACMREKSIRHGHPSMLHLWWARRPLAAARAIIFAQMVDDPSEHVDLFPTKLDQERERERLFDVIRELVQWENSTNELVVDRVRAELAKSWHLTCKENAKHPNAKELFNSEKLPAFYDPFAGGGSLPLEAQRLGLEAYASDLNPVAVLIEKAMIEIPPRFAGRPPVNPMTRGEKRLVQGAWHGAQGLAEDVRYYGQRMRDEAEKLIGNLYPKVEITPQMGEARPDLQPLVGKRLTVIAWLWVRTVKSPNPAFAHVDVPLATNFMLSTKIGKEAYVEPIFENGNYHFLVRTGRPNDIEAVSRGTKAGGSHTSFLCLMSGTSVPFEYIRSEARAGHMRSRLMSVVVEGERGRVYIPPSAEMEQLAGVARPTWTPDVEFAQQALGFRVGNYGLTKWSDLYTSRQLLALGTLSESVHGLRELVRHDALAAGWEDDQRGVASGGAEATAYADAVALYLGLLVDQQSNQSSMLCGWNNINQQMIVTFSRQVIRMVWDFAECNVFSHSTGSFSNLLERQVKAIKALYFADKPGIALQRDAAAQTEARGKIVSTDPPYYDNIGYADLSDYFYVWLRHSLAPVFPELLGTVATPKLEELVATPFRHGGRENAEAFFLHGMTQAMQRIAEQSHPGFPVTIYYAFKQAETKDGVGTSSTGWEVFLDALIRAGFAVTGTWPIKTESANKLKAQLNFLATCVVIVCRVRAATEVVATRRDFLRDLKTELPGALSHLQQGNIAPVDLAQAAIGPGMAVYTRYSKVLDADGKPLHVREALALINQSLDEILAEQEGDFDPDSRWAITWFDQYGFGEGEFDSAETLSKAKNTSVDGLVRAGIVVSRNAKVRLLLPIELTDKPSHADHSLTAWELLHSLIRYFDSGGEEAVARLVVEFGAKSEIARDLAYRLYAICDRKKRFKEAFSYNSLVQSWPEIIRLSRDTYASHPTQTDLLGAL